MTTIRLFFIIVAFAVAGCATSYQSSGLTGGYTETQLAPDVFRIVFRGNGYTTAERTQDFALLRAAELAQARGFSCFAIVDQRNSTSVSTFTTPGYATTNAYGTGSTTGYVYLNPYGGTYSGSTNVQINATTTYIPPQTYVSYKPRTGLLIRAFQSKPNGVFTFDVVFLQQSLKQKYGITGGGRFVKAVTQNPETPAKTSMGQGQTADTKGTYVEKYYIEGALLKQPTKPKRVFWWVLEPPKDSILLLLPLEDSVASVRDRLQKDGWEFTSDGNENYILMVSFRLLEYTKEPAEFYIKEPYALEVRFDLVDKAVYWSETKPDGTPTDSALARSKIWVTILTGYSDHDHWPSLLLNLIRKGGDEVGSYNAPGRTLGETVLPR